MQGYDALYLPGSDHAGIATQARVEEQLRNEGISRYDLGREKFLEVSWQWTKKYQKRIREQWKALGISVDYSRERFTLDEGLNQAVNHVFITLYNEGLIYRDYRIINWDPQALTALSNIEVEHVEQTSKLYTLRYPLVDEAAILRLLLQDQRQCLGIKRLWFIQMIKNIKNITVKKFIFQVPKLKSLSF